MLVCGELPLQSWTWSHGFITTVPKMSCRITTQFIRRGRLRMTLIVFPRFTIASSYVCGCCSLLADLPSIQPSSPAPEESERSRSASSPPHLLQQAHSGKITDLNSVELTKCSNLMLWDWNWSYLEQFWTQVFTLVNWNNIPLKPIMVCMLVHATVIAQYMHGD